MKKPVITLKEIRKAERKIGLRASKMIRDSLVSEINAINFYTRSISDEGLDRTVNVKPVMGNVRLFRISTSMMLHGFVLEQGASERSAHTRRIEKTNTFYTVKDHGFILRRIPFMEEAILKSGAFKHLFNEIGKLRMKEVAISFMQSDIKI